MITEVGTISLTLNQTYDLFVERVYYYSAQAKKLHRFKHYEKVPDLLAEVVDAENQILTLFGLPNAYEFSNVLDLFGWRRDINGNEIKKLFITLKQAAESYLLSPTKTDKQILIEAKESHLTAFDIFPLIGVERHSYNIFLYEQLFYRNDFDVDVVITALKKGNTIPPGIVSEMYSKQFPDGIKKEAIQTLSLKFWEEFVENKSNEKKIPSKRTVKTLDNIRYNCFGHFPQKISLAECYIGSIRYFDSHSPYIKAEIFLNPQQNQQSIYVSMPFEEIIKLLKKANNISVSSMVRSMLSEKLNESLVCTNDIEIRNCYSTYLYCKGIDLEVTQSNIIDDPLNEGGNPYYILNGFSFPDE